MGFGCEACGSKAGTYCLSKLGIATKHVHSSRMKQFGALTAAAQAKAIKASAGTVPQGPTPAAQGKASKAPAKRAGKAA
jgi:hypothetical protein